MKRISILLGVICGALFLAAADETHLTPAAASDDSEVWEMSRKAYSLFEQGDRLARKKDFAGARKAYSESFQLYQNISKQAPQWNPTVVANRMELARRAVRDMDRSAVASRQKQRPLPKDLASCQKELLEAREKIGELQDETLRLRNAARSGQVSGADVESLLAEKRDLLSEQASLRRRIAAQERRIETLSGNRTGGLEQQIMQLNALVDAQKARSRAAEDRVRTLEESLKKEGQAKEDALKRAAEAEAEKKNAERASSTAAFMARSREAELDQVQRDLTSAQVRARNLESELRQRGEEVQTLQSRFSRLQSGRPKEISAELVSENAELRRKVAVLTRQNTQLSEEAVALDQSRITLQKENSERKQAQAQLGSALEKTSHSLKMTQGAYQRELAAGKLAASELKQLRLSCRDLSAKVARLSGENRDLAEQLKNRDRQEQKDLKELSRRLGEMEQERNRLLAEAKTLRERCEKMVSVIDEKSEELAALKRASSQDKREIAVLRQTSRKVAALEQELSAAQKNSASADGAEKTGETKQTIRGDKNTLPGEKEELQRLRRRVAELEKQREELAILLRQQGVSVPPGTRAASGRKADTSVQQSMLSAARRAEAEGDYESAVWFYQELLKRDPRNRIYAEKIRVLSIPRDERR